MKQPTEVKAFKNELMNYHVYEQRIKTLSEKVELCYHLLGGIKSVDTTKEPIHSPRNIDAEYKLRDDIELYLDKIANAKAKINDLQAVLERIKDSEGEWVADAIFSLYANGTPSRKVAEKYHYAPSSILYVINKAIKKALEY